MSFRSDLTTLTDFILAPEFRTTVIAAALLAAAIAVGNAMGLGVNEPNSGIQIAFYGGATLASLMWLGAWTGLRAGSLKDRLAIPLLFVFAVIAADLIGHRLNSTPPSPVTNAVAALTIYLVVAIVFGIAQRFGWRLVQSKPIFQPLATDDELMDTSSTNHFSLAGLMGWISGFAVILSIAGWAAGNIDYSNTPHQITAGIGFGMVCAAFAILLAVPVLTLVFGGLSDPYLVTTPMMIVFSGLAFAGATNVEPGGAIFFAPIAAALIAFWLMRAYESIGYQFEHTVPTVRADRRTFAVGAAALLIAILLAGNNMAPVRAERQLKSQWLDRGIGAVTLSGNNVVFAAFNHDTPVTRRGSELLQDQTRLTMIQVEDDVTPEQIDWLMELPSVKTLILEGPFVSDEHLERLHGATHLKEIIYSRIGAKPKSIVALKRKLEPNVIVRDMWAPPANVTTTVPVKTQIRTAK